MASSSDSHAIQPSPDGRGVSRLNNEDWNRVQKAVTTLFQQRQTNINFDLESLRVQLSNLLKSDVREFIPQYYQEHLLKKGMIILREAVKEETGIALLQKLAQLWERFFCIILPKLQAIFCPIEVLNCSVQSLTLLSFRDIIVLKTKLDEALREQEGNVPPRIKQMLLVLQGVRESPPTENLIKLESMNRSERHRFKTSQSETGTQHHHLHVLHGALSIPGAPTGVSTATPLRHTSSSGTINPMHRSRSYSVHEIIPKASRLHAGGGGSSGGGSSRRSNEAIPDAIYKEYVKGSTLSLDELSTHPQRLSQQQRAEILAEFSDLKSTVV